MNECDDAGAFTSRRSRGFVCCFTHPSHALFSLLSSNKIRYKMGCGLCFPQNRPVFFSETMFTHVHVGTIRHVHAMCTLCICHAHDFLGGKQGDSRRKK